MLAILVATAAVLGERGPASWPFSCNANQSAQDIVAGLRIPGQVVVVTGADGDGGRAVVMAAATAGATVVLCGRNATRINATIKSTLAVVPAAKLDVSIFDLADLRSTRLAAQRLLAAYPTISALVNNAGGMSMAGKLTADSYDEMFEVQNLAPALLTDVLIPALIRGRGRVVNVASSAAYDPLPSKHLAADMLGFARDKPALSGPVGYGVSKRLVIHYTAELHTRMNGSISAIAVNPGYFRTPPFSLADKLACATVMKFHPCPQSPEQGASVVTFAALVPGAEAASGRLLDFETSIGALGLWSQTGENCVPRTLPKWDAAEVAKWYDAVQLVIRAEKERAGHPDDCPGSCSTGCGGSCICHGCQPFYCISRSSPEYKASQNEQKLRAVIRAATGITVTN